MATLMLAFFGFGSVLLATVLGFGFGWLHGFKYGLRFDQDEKLDPNRKYSVGTRKWPPRVTRT